MNALGDWANTPGSASRKLKTTAERIRDKVATPAGLQHGKCQRSQSHSESNYVGLLLFGEPIFKGGHFRRPAIDDVQKLLSRGLVTVRKLAFTQTFQPRPFTFIL